MVFVKVKTILEISLGRVSPKAYGLIPKKLLCHFLLSSWPQIELGILGDA